MSFEVVKVSKRIKDKWVLRDVSFTVGDAEVFGLFGPSGSGKSTLLDAVCGRIDMNGGSVKLEDRDVRLFRGMPTVEPSSFWSRLFPKPSGNTSPLEDHIAQTLANANQVVLLDEPMCGIDPSTRDRTVMLIRKAVEERRLSVCFASNDYTQILDVCDRVAVIIGGEIRQIGIPEEVYESPESRSVAALTGRNNLFPARRLTSTKAEIPEFYTLDGGHRLFAQRTDRGSLGALNQNVTLAIRPEQISLSFGASFPEDNLLKATITGVHFRGPTTLVKLDADGLELEAIVLRLVGLNVGDECMVGLPPDRILVLKD